MKIAIKNPAPKGPSLERWGDFHFGKSLQAALEAYGAEVVQHFWPDWSLDAGADATLWLRGKRRCTPQPGTVNAIWIMSHPATVTADELEAFDLVYAGSERLAEELASIVTVPVEVMRQCTDARLFPGRTVPEDGRHGLLFLANSRNVRRPVLDWCLQAGLRPSVIGRGWGPLGLRGLVVADYVANADLPALYASARYGMNDHWGDMGHYQIVNNRIFDCMASGLPLISDGFPELEQVAGDAVRVVHDPGSFLDAYWELRLDHAQAVESCRKRWTEIGPEHTFDARAARIMVSLGNVRPGPADADLPAAQTVEWADQLLERAGGLGPDPTRITRGLLHVCPARASLGAIAARPSLSIISAGWGPGPWNIRLDDGLDDIRGRQFDVVYIEDAVAWNGGTCPGRLLPRLADHLRPGGHIGASEDRILQSLLEDPRLGHVSTSPLILRRTVDDLLEPLGRGRSDGVPLQP